MTYNRIDTAHSAIPVCRPIGTSCFDLSSTVIGRGACATVRLGFLNHRRASRCVGRDSEPSHDGAGGGDASHISGCDNNNDDVVGNHQHHHQRQHERQQQQHEQHQRQHERQQQQHEQHQRQHERQQQQNISAILDQCDCRSLMPPSPSSSLSVFSGSSDGMGAHMVAVKIVNKRKVLDRMGERALQYQQREVRTLQRMRRENNDNIIRLFYAEETANSIKMVLEYCQLNFNEYLNQRSTSSSRAKRGNKSGSNSGSGSTSGRWISPFLSEQEIQYWLRQIANGLKCLRKYNYVHRDLKPHNLMLCLKQKGAASTSSSALSLSAAPLGGCVYSDFTIKIVDFGFTRELEDTDLASTLCGTKAWMAPEQFQRLYSNTIDLWAIGVIMLQMITGKNPFRNQSLEFLAIQSFKLQDHIRQYDLSNNCRNLLTRLMVKDPNDRIGFDEFFDHPFLRTDAHHYRQQPHPNLHSFSPQQDDNVLRSATQDRRHAIATPEDGRSYLQAAVDGRNDSTENMQCHGQPEDESNNDDLDEGFELVDDFEDARHCAPVVEGTLEEGSAPRKYRFTIEEAGQYIILVHNEHDSWFLHRDFQANVQMRSNRSDTGFAGNMTASMFRSTLRSTLHAQVLRSVDFPISVSNEQIPCTITIALQMTPVMESSWINYLPLSYLGMGTVPYKIEIVRLS